MEERVTKGPLYMNILFHTIKLHMEDVTVVRGGGIITLPGFSHCLLHADQHLLAVGPSEHIAISRVLMRTGTLGSLVWITEPLDCLLLPSVSTPCPLSPTLHLLPLELTRGLLVEAESNRAADLDREVTSSRTRWNGDGALTFSSGSC